MDRPESNLDHEAFMRSAIAMAEKNRRFPFGCVIVDRRNRRIVASGVNQSKANPTLHGEVDAINDYAERKNSDWEFLTLYTTAEPCCMCQGAILWSGIREVVFGTSIQKLIRYGWKQIDISAREVVGRSWDPAVVTVPDVLADQCDRLFELASRK